MNVQWTTEQNKLDVTNQNKLDVQATLQCDGKLDCNCKKFHKQILQNK